MFADGRITLQPIRVCQPTFSAAMIGHVEAAYEDEAQKNELCTPIPYPTTDVDWLRVTLTNSVNAARWNTDPKLMAWLQGARLDVFSAALPDGPPNADQIKLIARIGEHTPGAIKNLSKLLAEFPK